MNEAISCKEHLHTEHGAWCVCSSFLIKPEYLVQVGWKDLLMNNHRSWWKDSKVCCRSETTNTLIWKAAPRVTQFLQFNKPFIRHTKAPFVRNEEWIKTTSSEYATCLTVIEHSALNRNINQRTPCKWIQILIRKAYVSPQRAARGRQKSVQSGTHLAAVDNGVPVLALVIHHVDVIQVGIGPIHQLLDHIQRHSSGLLDFIIDQPGPVGAVHVTALHLGHVPIVSEEEHSAGEGGLNH